MNEEQLSWEIIDKYFKETPHNLVKHHIDSYNDFVKNGIKQNFREKNPIKIYKKQNPETKEFDYQCRLYFGGKDGNKVYYGRPMIYDDGDRSHYMYPNEARLRNMTYGMTVHYDVDAEFTILTDAGERIEKTITLEKIFLGRLPIMLQSDLCILGGLSRDVRFNMGECRNDPGGYFIIDGKEKLIISQEKFADNMLNISDKGTEEYTHSAEIRSVSEDVSKPIRKLSIRIMAGTSSLRGGNIVVNIPNVRKPVPLFILMRALGVISDKEIIQHCLLNIEENSHYLELFRTSIHDAGPIFTQEAAIEYIRHLTKTKTVATVMHILMDYLLPHIGELNFKDKALYIGYIVRRLLRVVKNEEKATDRDSFKTKRIQTTGNLLYELFREYWNLDTKEIYKKFDKEYYFHENVYQNTDFISLIEKFYTTAFQERTLEKGFRKAFKGSWGSQEHTHIDGVVQDLNRLSFNSALSLLRKVNLPIDSNAKVVGPRILHMTQWGITDPLDTPDGGSIGLNKHLAIMTHITNGESGYPYIKMLRELGMLYLAECNFDMLNRHTKAFVNGAWVGIISNPQELQERLRALRRNGAFSLYTSIRFDILRNEFHVNTDAGRPCRPLIHIQDNKINYYRPNIADLFKTGKYTYKQLVSGFMDDKSKIKRDMPLELLQETAGVIDYIDTMESDSVLIATEPRDFVAHPATHMELHPTTILGVMGNQIIFPENNPVSRNQFSCGQSKQGISLYHTNYQVRIDKMGVVLNDGQIPLVKSRYMKYINNEEHPYGVNAIVAISCYSGYNVEDAILINRGAIERGLFRMTYFSMYETREESSKVSGSMIDSKIMKIEGQNVFKKKPGYDYSQLDDNGLVTENTILSDKVVLIGRASNTTDTPDAYVDSSVTPKKGQLGYVDKAFMTDGEEGFRIAKVRVREERYPSIGDKFCSRCGQKGTIGLIIPESDMPFTADGTRPDLIINPHALPSRMTIGQLIESLMGKAGLLYGAHGDCTAFVNKGPKHAEYGEMLTNMGYHSSGNEVLYNGMTGEQMESDIFIGPSYYMRLKHMVKDKINYRTRGPRTALTRQTVQGRANDGGLRIGEMERDGVIAHGLNHFLNESHMVRGDEYYMAICNNTGTMAIYNEDRNLFLSPGADGPIKFTTAIDETMNIENVSRYGRSFSIIRIPYTFKLLMQELGTMNISMRIITEDNVDQLYNMSYSNTAQIHNSSENSVKTRVPLITDFKYPKSVDTPSPVRTPYSDESSPYSDESSAYSNESTPYTPERNVSLPPYPASIRPQEEGDAYEEIYKARHPEEFDEEGKWIYEEESPKRYQTPPGPPPPEAESPKRYETPPPPEAESPQLEEENITMDIKEPPQILTAVSKEPVLERAPPSPEFYIPSDIVDSPEKREAYLEMRRKEEEERKNNPVFTGGAEELSLLTDIAEDETGEQLENDNGEKKFIVGN
jgi:DNA-directed RNA polymerase II subunit RPB2